MQEFNQRERQEEVCWSQKSHIKWLQEAKHNTSFFHKATIQHRKGNRLDRLKKEDGSIAETQEDLENTLHHYFANLLQEPDRDREEAQREVLRHIPKLITEYHNKVLGKAIEMSEFEMEVTQMAKYKASGPDGFTSNFFHAGWEWLKEEIVALVEDSQISGNILKALNSTFMALIPKESST